MSKETKHTPGPWVAGSDPCHFDAPEVRSAEWAIYVPKFDDARLIAAAPELLATSKALLATCERYLEEIGDCDHSVNICCCDLKREISEARHAIAKATTGYYLLPREPIHS